ncbi:hypothetical protein [Paracoccus alkanivorans]|uniref:hypothetical protein n=1 Tax=Paracoccus alkanivorans TaxID=2116655 RepID=UPI001AA0887D|nr:hypothetical protein [Paracoccus alkanivorans]
MIALTVRDEPLPAPDTEAGWRAALSDPHWRLSSGVLYKILIKGDDDTEGQVAPFLPNQNQIDFLHEMRLRNLILKARQLGFTTLACIYALDLALFVPNQRCGIIAHHQDDAAVILRDKVKFAYDNLPEALRERMPLDRESAKELLFAHNNSGIRVATSVRSGTINFLHISEMGKIAAKFPAKATEIVTGSLPAVPKTGIATIESTAEGTEGEFYKIATRAENLAMSKQPIPDGEFCFHFYPWFKDPGYVADPRLIRISPTQHEYFDRIEVEMDTSLSMPQRAWYVQKLEADFSGDVFKMYREMPSTPKECWMRNTEGKWLTRQLDQARRDGRITMVPHLPGLPVHTFWDIGAGDGTGIWCMQQIGLASRFIRYIEGWGEGYSYYVNALRQTGWVFGTMHLPHDAAQTRQLATTIGQPIQMLQELAPDWRWTIVPRAHDFQAAVETLRDRFPEAWFDEENCKEGLTHLALYSKKFNTRLGTFIDQPEKDDGHSEAPDALRQWAQGFDPQAEIHRTQPNSKPRRRKVRRATGMTA